MDNVTTLKKEEITAALAGIRVLTDILTSELDRITELETNPCRYEECGTCHYCVNGKCSIIA